MDKESFWYKSLKTCFGFIVRPIKRSYYNYRNLHYTRVAFRNFKQTIELEKSKDFERQCIYYLGITALRNLGDMAQHYCILKWIEENYPNAYLFKIESDAICDLKDDFFRFMKSVFNYERDIIIFQSGYSTQDLGGNHPLMHILVIDEMTNAKILMMPQTVYFQHAVNKQRFSENHNKAKNMFFLARDTTSYVIAKEMFPSIRVNAFPDIVTTLIGSYQFNNPRIGVCVCTRNDGEKLYSEDEIESLVSKFQSDGLQVLRKDTQGNCSFSEIRANLQYYIEKEIESYSHFKVTITDRYHGTIFSLCAGTPAIIIKTTDHKVTTGAEWFRGIYDDYIYVANDLDDAYDICNKVMDMNLNNRLQPYFKEKFYDKLKVLFEDNSSLK